MARRRLQMILATTTITVGLTAAPAAAQDLTGLSSVVEDTVTTVEETTTEVVDAVEETVAPSDTSTQETEEPLDVQVGTEDGTLHVDLQVDVAPSDDDGSPQLEVDGGVTVDDQHVDIGETTEPIEDAVDPDPQPAPDQRQPDDGNTSSDAHQPRVHRSGPGGFLEGGGVMAAGDDARPVEAPGDEPSARSLGSGFAAHGALDRGGFGFSRDGGGTMRLDAVPDPEVAPPAAAGAPAEAPQVLGPEFAPETPAVFASGAVPGASDGPVSGLLKALAAAMVLGTGAVWTRATRGA